VIGRALRTLAVFDHNGTRWLMQVLSPPPTLRKIILLDRGRNSGRLYKTPLSILHEDPARAEVVVAPMFGRDADWYRNVIAGGLVEIHVGGEKRHVEWRELDEAERRAAREAFREAHPMYSRILLRRLARMHGLDPDSAEVAGLNSPMLGLRDVGS
jgi:deazaflavin-dependent oxidoreductase (nitroreductase family)